MEKVLAESWVVWKILTYEQPVQDENMIKEDSCAVWCNWLIRNEKEQRSLEVCSINGQLIASSENAINISALSADYTYDIMSK